MADEPRITESCDNCDFFGGRKLSICRRWGPTVFLIQERVPQLTQSGQVVDQMALVPKPFWTPVGSGDWCGEWTPVEFDRPRGAGGINYGNDDQPRQ